MTTTRKKKQHELAQLIYSKALRASQLRYLPLPSDSPPTSPARSVHYVFTLNFFFTFENIPGRLIRLEMSGRELNMKKVMAKRGGRGRRTT